MKSFSLSPKLLVYCLILLGGTHVALTAADIKSTWPTGLVAGEPLLVQPISARDFLLSKGIIADAGTYSFTSEQNNIRLSYTRNLNLPFAFQAKIIHASDNHKIQVVFSELSLSVVFSKQFQCVSIVMIDPTTLTTEREIAKIPYAVIGAKISSLDDFTLTVAMGETKFAVWLDNQPLYTGPQLIVVPNHSSSFSIHGAWNSAFEVSGINAVKIKSLQFPTIKPAATPALN